MSGPTIGNWNKFDANVFKSISGVPDENTQRLETETSKKPRSAASSSSGPRADPT